MYRATLTIMMLGWLAGCVEIHVDGQEYICSEHSQCGTGYSCHLPASEASEAPGVCRPECVQETDCAPGEGKRTLCCEAGVCHYALDCQSDDGLVITEIMYNPQSHPNGQWFEVKNTGGAPFDLEGCWVEIGEHEFRVDVDCEGLFVLPGSYVVFAYDLLDLGEIPVYPYGSECGEACEMDEVNDSISVRCGEETVLRDEVDRSPAQPRGREADPTFPSSEKGKAIQLELGKEDVEENDNGGNWCPADSKCDDCVDSDDLGTPGADNTACAKDPNTLSPPRPDEMIFTEIMFNPLGDESSLRGEWFELLNLSTADVNLRDCVITDESGQRIEVDSDYVVGAGERVVFYDDDDDSLVEGVENAYEYDQLPLNNNEGDTLTLKCGDGEMVARVTYDCGCPFPDCKQGWSLQLDPDRRDPQTQQNQGNDVLAGWCLANKPCKDSDPDLGYGTPGRRNDECDPCDRNPCVEDTCVPNESLTRRTGACSDWDADGVAECDNPQVVSTEDCKKVAGTVKGTPEPGDVIFSEIMYWATNEPETEWFELYNRSGDAVDLGGCVLSDNRVEVTIDEGVVLADGEYAVFACLGEEELGFAPKWSYGVNGCDPDKPGERDIALSNDTDTLTLKCGPAEQTIDTVTYETSDDWPRKLKDRAIAYDEQPPGATGNDSGQNWRTVTVRYGETDGVSGRYGTPGCPDKPCMQ